jgi:2-iminobutanoate/2-iminopropanoate deaminase
MKKWLILTMLIVMPVLAQKKIIYPPEFRPNAPFSPGVLVGGTLYVAGQTGTDLKTNKLPENFQDEVRSTLDRVGIILKAAGMDYSDAVSVIVYMTDLTQFAQMNEVYTTYFKANRPVRATVQVAGLVGGAKVEISVTAHK